ncbi:Hydroxyacylglutathione hydrolase, mitochondrial [Choanephora cucurbitarum]|uniref:hydroxyacylglutathione hydrolase n=1 Tax=Choanephora cucurbitarum TaxID=101091 RepID=A0A1C7NKG3_9FUNG|nr:Hydroxyacylglutathione hydrolase, mitochondrial [Choanephora cucurbitarum]
MLIKPVKCLQDNYAYILLDQKSKKAAAIDPVEPDHILEALEEYPDYTLSMILTTHHHWDHAGGNVKLTSKQSLKDIVCYGGSEKVEGVQKILKDNDTIQLGDLNIRALTTTGHTMDHLCYYIEHENDRAVFTGDCLFSSGCGRFFEGTPEDMYKALSKLMALPDDTKIYFGHEYTLSNLKFAEHVEPDNKDIQEKIRWAKEIGCTTPSSLQNEKLTNPFMRVHEPKVVERVMKDSSSAKPVDVLGELRKMKDNF